MEGLSRRSAGVWNHRAVSKFAVDGIAAEDVASFGQVDSNLMGTSGFQLALDKAVGSDFLDWANVSDRMLLGRVGGFNILGLGTSMAISSVAD